MAIEKPKRVVRSEHLPPEQVAGDDEFRRKVTEEFPPSHAASPPASNSLSESLREAIRQSGRSVTDIAGDAHISTLLLDRFLSADRDIPITAADRLASVLGLKLSVD